jgi:hypothetical protein
MKLLFLACATSFFLVEVLATLITPLKVPRVLVIGGTGRVGGSAVLEVEKIKK